MDFSGKFKLLWVLIALALAVLLKEVLFIVFLGILFGIILTFPIGFFSKVMPRGLAVILTVVLLGASAATLAHYSFRPLAAQFKQVKDHAPEAMDKVKAWLEKAQGQGALPPMPEGHTVTQSIQKQAGDAAQNVLSKTGEFAISLGAFLSALVIILVLAAFLAHEPDSYRKALKALIPRSAEGDFDDLWERLSLGLRHWLGGILISMTIMGAVTATGLFIAGIQDWPLLALLTFFGTFIPFVGAIGSAVPGLILALGQSGQKFVYALLVYLLVHMIEGYIVQPLIMKRAVVIRPASLLIWQLVMGTLGGILGVIVATPLLVCVKIMVGNLYIEKKLGKTAEQV